MIRPEDASDVYGPDYERGYSQGYADGWRDAVQATTARLNMGEDEKQQEIIRLRGEIAAMRDEYMKMTSPTESGRQGGIL